MTVLVSPANAADTPGSETIGQALGQLIQTDDLPGGQAVVAKRGKSREISRGVGDLRTGKPFPHQSRVRIGSNTKAFVATVVLQLRAEGRVELDVPVDRYLPGVVRGNGNDGSRITVRHLLQHTSGLTDYTGVIDASEMRWRIVKPMELVSAALSQPPRFQPGARWEYSNTNYILVGMIVERITGHSVADEVTRRIIVPLGLTTMYYPKDYETWIRGPHPRGYVEDEGKRYDYTNQNMTWGGAAGAMIGTGEDLNRFYTALLAGRLLPPAQLAEMKRTVPATLFPNAGYGLGLVRFPLSCGVDIWGHGGTVPGFRTRGGVTADGRAVNVSVNQIAASPDGSAHVMRVVDTAICSSD